MREREREREEREREREGGEKNGPRAPEAYRRQYRRRDDPTFGLLSYYYVDGRVPTVRRA